MSVKGTWSRVKDHEAVAATFARLADSKKRAQLMEQKPKIEHWIVSGRIPFDDEDTTLYVEVGEGETAMYVFTTNLYNLSDKSLPDDWMEVKGPDEGWVIINTEIQISEPPLQFHCHG